MYSKTKSSVSSGLKTMQEGVASILLLLNKTRVLEVY